MYLPLETVCLVEQTLHLTSRRSLIADGRLLQMHGLYRIAAAGILVHDMVARTIHPYQRTHENLPDRLQSIYRARSRSLNASLLAFKTNKSAPPWPALGKRIDQVEEHGLQRSADAHNVVKRWEDERGIEGGSLEESHVDHEDASLQIRKALGHHLDSGCRRCQPRPMQGICVVVWAQRHVQVQVQDQVPDSALTPLERARDDETRLSGARQWRLFELGRHL